MVQKTGAPVPLSVTKRLFSEPLTVFLDVIKHSLDYISFILKVE